MCGDEMKAGWGMHPFIEGTWTPICLDCLMVEDILLSYLHTLLSPMTLDILDHMNEILGKWGARASLAGQVFDDQF